MKLYNSFISKNILLLCLFTGITSSLNHVKAQSDSLQIKSDTLFIKGIPQAKYFLSIVRGVDLNVEIQTYFFESDFRKKFDPYRKDFEKIVKQDLRSKGLFVKNFFFFKYYDITKLPIEYLQNDSVIISSTNQLDSVAFYNVPLTAGDYLVKAGKSYNAVIVISLITAILAPILAPSIGVVGTGILVGGVSIVSLITVVSANSNIIKAGKELNALKNQPSLK
jgi:hypothetical protein